jgi:hypothetical protein
MHVAPILMDATGSGSAVRSSMVVTALFRSIHVMVPFHLPHNKAILLGCWHLVHALSLFYLPFFHGNSLALI